MNNSLLQIFAQNIHKLTGLLTPIRYCNQGFCVVRKTFGVPNRIFQPGLCYKIPLIQAFDCVNMKKQVHFLNTHSNKYKKQGIVPYNVSINAQIEYRIIDPMVIYHIDIIDLGSREPIRIYVDNEVHLLIGSIIEDETLNISKAQELINEKLNQRNKNPKDYFQRAILIERIVVNALDYNIALKNNQLLNLNNITSPSWTM